MLQNDDEIFLSSDWPIEHIPTLKLVHFDKHENIPEIM